MDNVIEGNSKNKPIMSTEVKQEQPQEKQTMANLFGGVYRQDDKVTYGGNQSKEQQPIEKVIESNWDDYCDMAAGSSHKPIEDIDKWYDFLSGKGEIAADIACFITDNTKPKTEGKELFEFVKASEELPEDKEPVFAQNKDNKYLLYHSGKAWWYYETEDIYLYDTDDVYNSVEWLKPIQIYQQALPIIDKGEEIEKLLYHFREVVFAANRMRDNYAEGDDKVKRSLWTTLHTKADAARDFYEDLRDSRKSSIKPIEAKEQGNEAVEIGISVEEYEHAINEIGQLQQQLKEAEEEIRDLNRRGNCEW